MNAAAQSTALNGLRTRVPTMVAMEFAESWKPFMKSKLTARIITRPSRVQLRASRLGMF